MSRTIFICCFILSSILGYSQINARFHAGAGAFLNNNAAITPDGSFHRVTSVGIDAILSPGNPGILVGFHYNRLGLNHDNTDLFTNEANVDLLEGRLGLNINILNFNDWIKLRSKLVGVGMIDVDGDYDAVDGLGYGPINDFQGGGLFGIGMTVGYLLIDLEYLHLFNDAFETVEDSNFTGFQFKLGFTF